MLDGRGDNAEAGEGGGYNGGFSSGPRSQPASAPREDFSADLDDEIPF